MSWRRLTGSEPNGARVRFTTAPLGRNDLYGKLGTVNGWDNGRAMIRMDDDRLHRYPVALEVISSDPRDLETTEDES